ncbi:uncharacterized protein KD926_011335 [Aspergillus affinis]|uniref:uncharacterized protein n=1 Tax=Aspergillus affinis TaxID=1070780 RepID=UPI0022FE6D6A|nr:uncharacterized protein KD926_011335 [Aspergillus affinis]KAI9038097.1 hypothetical protein KD926_011335 [Aspergillus affinis]
MQLYHPIFLFFGTTVIAEVMKLGPSPKLHQRCTGISQSQKFSGLLQPSIIVQMDPVSSISGNESSSIVSVVIFELGDEHLGGHKPAGSETKEIICTPRNVKNGICPAEQLGSFIVTPEAFANANSPIITRAVNLSEPETLIYPVQNQGFYCAATYGYSTRQYSGLMTARDVDGLLPAFQRPCLYLYKYLSVAVAGWSIIYVAIWAFYTKQRGMTSVFLHALVFLSFANVTVRWASYASRTLPDTTNILGWASTALDSFQIVTLGYLLFVLPRSGTDLYSWAIASTPATPWVVTGALAVLTTCYGVNELQRTAESLPILTAVLGGSMAAGLSWTSLRTSREAWPVLKQDADSAKSSIHSSMFWISVTGAILCLIVTV